MASPGDSRVIVKGRTIGGRWDDEEKYESAEVHLAGWFGSSMAAASNRRRSLATSSYLFESLQTLYKTAYGCWGGRWRGERPSGWIFTDMDGELRRVK